MADMFSSMFGAFGAISTVMFLVFIAIFLIIFTIVIRTFLRQSAKERENDKQPQQTVRARVVAKRTAVWGDHAHTDYYVTFELDSRERTELHLQGEEYGMLAEGDEGMLTVQGTRYLGFDRQ